MYDALSTPLFARETTWILYTRIILFDGRARHPRIILSVGRITNVVIISYEKSCRRRANPCRRDDYARRALVVASPLAVFPSIVFPSDADGSPATHDRPPRSRNIITRRNTSGSSVPARGNALVANARDLVRRIRTRVHAQY